MKFLQIRRVRRVLRTGEFRDVNLASGLNLLIGEQNTSKTTTLRIIDYCLGDSRSPAAKFGNAISQEYLQFELTVSIGGVDHNLVRRLHQARQLTLTEVDGIPMSASRFNEWISNELDWPWPPILIPRGRQASAATNEDPLTFRAIYRHIYRRATSWSEFADEEQEYYRRGVIAFLLGVAREAYDPTTVQLTRTEVRDGELSQRGLELRALLDDVVQRATVGFRQAGTTGLDSIDETLAEVTSEVSRMRIEHDRLAESLRSNPRYDREKDHRLSNLQQAIQSNVERGAELSQVIKEQQGLLFSLQLDLEKIARARLARRSLGSISVTTCPACYRPIEATEGANDESCYVCLRPLEPDVHTRRLELEERSLGGEAAELRRLVGELSERLTTLRNEHRRLTRQREELVSEIDRERRELIAPVLRELEAMQMSLGRLEERQASLRRLSGLTTYISTLAAERAAVDEELKRLRAESQRQGQDRGLILERASLLQRYMNEFVTHLPLNDGLGGTISIDVSDFSFYVGREVWDQGLGNERQVLFLLAYHYGLLRLASDDLGAYPGLAVLDNPFQQDVDPVVVQEGLQALSAVLAANSDLQIVVATRRELHPLPGTRVHFGQTYNPDELRID